MSARMALASADAVIARIRADMLVSGRLRATRFQPSAETVEAYAQASEWEQRVIDLVEPSARVLPFRRPANGWTKRNENRAARPFGGFGATTR